MSPRDTYWFLAGAASGLMIGALGVYFLINTPGASTSTASASTASGATPPSATPDLLMPGEKWPTLADADSAGVNSNASGAAPTRANSSAGSLEQVTRNLAQRLATKGGTDDEWRLLAQSYDYMGRTNDARAARMHVAATAASTTGSEPADGTQAQNEAGGSGAKATRITGTVQITPQLAALAPSGATLFVYATEPGTPGPPLAVRKLQVDRWPVSFVLDDADAMIPGRNLSASQHVVLEARVSPTAEALPRRGDLIGKLENVDPKATQPVKISIDRKL
jgi:hypothetical protein